LNGMLLGTRKKSPRSTPARAGGRIPEPSTVRFPRLLPCYLSAWRLSSMFGPGHRPVIELAARNSRSLPPVLTESRTVQLPFGPQDCDGDGNRESDRSASTRLHRPLPGSMPRRANRLAALPSELQAIYTVFFFFFWFFFFFFFFFDRPIRWTPGPSKSHLPLPPSSRSSKSQHPSIPGVNLNPNDRALKPIPPGRIGYSR